MQPKDFRRDNPERKIQDALIQYMQARYWKVVVMSASIYTQGMPDLFCTHRKNGIRLVEVKLPMMIGSKFTPAQEKLFPELVRNGSPIWILTGASEEQYNLLFSKPDGNYHEYASWKF